MTRITRIQSPVIRFLYLAICGWDVKCKILPRYPIFRHRPRAEGPIRSGTMSRASDCVIHSLA